MGEAHGQVALIGTIAVGAVAQHYEAHTMLEALLVLSVEDSTRGRDCRRSHGFCQVSRPEAGWALEPLHFHLPLPCFIRGDDVEYGRRLHEQVLFTVSLPGIAVWHEPFQLRLDGWQLYYETRNMLIAAALHFPRRGRGLAVLVLKRLLGQLLTYRDYSAALDAKKARFPLVTMEAERVASPARLAPDPRGRAPFLARLARATIGDLLGRAPAPQPAVPVPIRDLLWFRVLHHDRIVAETGWEANAPVSQRDPVAFRQLLVRGLRLVVRLAYRAAPVRAAWRDARWAPRL